MLGDVVMSIIRAITCTSKNKLVIPSAGKMFRSNISKDNKALCFVFNKGYLETEDLSIMISILSVIKGYEGCIFLEVGEIEKVRLTTLKRVVYRQRLFFKSLKDLILVCKRFGVRVELSSNFHININNIMNCIDDLEYLERYAARYDETIDTWLTNTCMIHLHNLLLSLRMYSGLERRVDWITRGRLGYLDRAPFLVLSYSIDDKSSAIFLEDGISDNRLYSIDTSDKLNLRYGYTLENVRKDVGDGII